jgi:hypothetical protein
VEVAWVSEDWKDILVCEAHLKFVMSSAPAYVPHRTFLKGNLEAGHVTFYSTPFAPATSEVSFGLRNIQSFGGCSIFFLYPNLA